MNQNVKDVISILRRDIPMPWIYPKLYDNCLRWFVMGNYTERTVCPLGLHPLSLERLPYKSTHFLEDIFTIKQINEFLTWWDNLKDPKKAYKAIWG